MRYFLLIEAQFAPARLHRIEIFLRRPHRRREARAAEIGIGVVVEIEGGVDQHAIPFAGAELRDVAVAPPGRRIEPGAKGRRHDDDIVLAGIDAIGDRPIDRRVIVNVDIVVDHGDVLVAHMRGRRAPQRVGDLLGLAAIALFDLHHRIDAGLHRRTPHIGDAGHAGAIEHVPRRRRPHDRGADAVLRKAAGHRAFDGAAQDRIVAVGDAGDADGRFRRAVAGDIAGELRERAFHRIGVGFDAEIALDHDLGAGRHVKIDGLAFDQLDRRAADGADDIVFANALGHRRAADEVERRLPADRHRDRHFLVTLLLPGGDVMADMLGAPHQDRNRVLAGDHAAIDADIHHAAVGILGDDAAIGENVAAAVGTVPMRHRELIKIDVVAFDDVFLHRTGLDDVRRRRCR